MAQTRSAGRAPGRAPGGAQARCTRHGTRYASPFSSIADESERSDRDSHLDVVIISSDSESTASDDAPLALRRRRPISILPSSRSNTTSSSVPRLLQAKNNKSASSRRGVASSHEKINCRQTENTTNSARDPSRGRLTVVSPGKHKKQQRQQKQKRATLQGHGADQKNDHLQKSHRPPPVIPDWLDLRIPYDCWVSIFSYAGCESSPDGPNTGWLLSAATTCRAFAEPALTAIYRCPVLRTPSKAKRLAALLECSPAETLFNYRAKIESLHIDIHIVPQNMLYRLIHPLFRLRELVIFTTTDQPPYRKLETNVRWHYTEDIFKALLAGPKSGPESGPKSETPALASTEKPFPTVLKSWEWSGRLLGGHVATVDDIARIHRMPSFAHLTRVSFTNFQVPSLQLARIDSDFDEESDREDALVVEAVARAISELKSLKHLVFESSTVMDGHLLSLLPDHLLHLELINCWEVTSQDLAFFLRTRGSQLRTLSLLHNQSLNLEFLTDLADNCPNLRVLHMNMSYYHHHFPNYSSQPFYDYALLPWQIPNWPSTLRVLNIENIRDWNEETAEMFLQSIAGSSEKLTDLRHLFIKTMLDIPWQARAELRNKWRLEMERIFRRPVIPPLPRTSLRDSYAVEDEEDKDKASKASYSKRKRLHPASHPPSPSRRSSRIADVQAQRDVASRRARGGGRPVYREPATDEEEFDVSSDEESASEDGSLHKRRKDGEDASHVHEPTIQGLCNTVNILFDNQKPTEVQWGMEDFFGAEESDREWNGDDDDEDDDDGAIAF